MTFEKLFAPFHELGGDKNYDSVVDKSEIKKFSNKATRKNIKHNYKIIKLKTFLFPAREVSLSICSVRGNSAGRIRVHVDEVSPSQLMLARKQGVGFPELAVLFSLDRRL